MSQQTGCRFGIDYGSKLAGTTVIAQWQDGEPLQFWQSTPKKDADAFLIDFFAQQAPSFLFLDAPLSLPGKYRFPDQYQDYFYRLADRELKAMSPMFLGGLTARAMKLSETLRAQGHQLFEAYPGALARILELKNLQYKKAKSNLPAVLDYLATQCPFTFNPEELPTWHHVDALLAAFIAHRHAHQKHLCYGSAAEGQIFV